MSDYWTVKRLGHLGDGLADGADGPVRVPFSLPGERVAGNLVDGRIPDPQIVTPSPDRADPPCPHFGTCGGCALQHASDRFVARWKAQVVARALAARDLPAPITRVVVSPPRSRRRAVLSGRRTKSGVQIGFHARGSDVITEIGQCHVLHPQIVAVLPFLSELVARGASRSAELSMTVTQTTSGADVTVQGGKPLDLSLRHDLSILAGKGEMSRLTWDDEPVAEVRPPLVLMDGIPVVPPPGGFLQATEHGQAALIDAVSRALLGAKRVVDLFSGCGTFALPLARHAEVHAVESEAAALSALDRAWRNFPDLRAVSTETRDLFRRPLLGAELLRFDGAVIDPPRAGAEAQIAELSAFDISRIAMVSCNPVTFARDAKTLVDAGYKMDRIEVVDQFRWSPHVELVAAFTRAHMGGKTG